MASPKKKSVKKNTAPSKATGRKAANVVKSRTGKAAAAKSTAPRGKQAPSPSNIPMPLTSFVGRERELEQISELLGSSRLLTLTGPGGVGMTSWRPGSDSFTSSSAET